MTTSYGEHSGPRERLGDVGVRALSDEELLAILISTGVRGEGVVTLASRLLQIFGGLSGLERTGIGELSELAGIGIAKASRIVAALEIGKRIASRPLSRGAPLLSSADIYAAFGPRLLRLSAEHFYAVPLDAKNRPTSEICLAVGGLISCPVHPSDVYRALLKEAAVSVVFIHNHPSGDPDPSPDDIWLTERLRLAGELLGIRVLDHVIVGDGRYFSFRDAGVLCRADDQRDDQNKKG